jgi:hypothetical protein
MATKHVTPSPTYQLKITLREITPPIWRRVLVPGDLSLDKLHLVIQAAMGFWNYHLHVFEIDGARYGLPDRDGELEFIDERKILLEKVVRRPSTFMYEYDFGDGWEHDVVVEKILKRPTQQELPAIVDGERSGPHEDAGGYSGHDHLVAVLADPKHEEHDELRAWAGADYDPARFDRVAIAKDLHALARRWRPRAKRAGRSASP